ncbi:MAG: hypothetical protein CMF61_01915 [Magnetococcales bacterium]|nr:hypothetical protein [Magnetococcales bacterium]
MACKNINITSEEVTKWHCKLFPEEYDMFYDSILESNLRAQGINPMSKEYIERVNKRRRSLGFSDFNVNGENGNTRAFVLRMLKQGKEGKLIAYLNKYKEGCGS